MSKLILLLTFTLVIALSSCSYKKDSKIFLLEKDSDGKTVKMNLNDKIIVILKNNPTTGYSWTITRRDSRMLKFIRKVYDPTKPIVPGSGGKDYFEFYCVKEGINRLKLVYSRQWKKDIQRSDSFTVLLQINN